MYTYTSVGIHNIGPSTLAKCNLYTRRATSFIVKHFDRSINRTLPYVCIYKLYIYTYIHLYICENESDNWEIERRTGAVS